LSILTIGISKIGKTFGIKIIDKENCWQMFWKTVISGKICQIWHLLAPCAQ